MIHIHKHTDTRVLFKTTSVNKNSIVKQLTTMTTDHNNKDKKNTDETNYKNQIIIASNIIINIKCNIIHIKNYSTFDCMHKIPIIAITAVT